MLKNLSQAVPAGSALPFMSQARPTANQRAKTITTALLGIAGVLLVVCAGIAYVLYGEIGQAQQQVGGLLAQEQSSAQITGEYETTLQSYNDTAGQLQSLESTLPPAQYIPTLLQQLQTLALETNLQVNSLKPGPIASTALARGPAPAAVADPGYQTQPIQLTVSGTYRQIMTFIYALPTFPKILSLQTVALMPKGSGTGLQEPELTANLLINAYVFTPPTATDNGAAAPGIVPSAALNAPSTPAGASTAIPTAAATLATGARPLQSPLGSNKVLEK